MVSAEAYLITPRQGIRSLTTKLPKSADSGRERAWNHGAWHSVRFSTSDGTDPRENGRTYSLIKN